jgi:hypothetical protein
MKIPILRIENLNTDEIRRLTCEQNILENGMSCAIVRTMPPVSPDKIANRERPWLDPKMKFATKANDESDTVEHALLELYRVPYFAQSKDGQVVTKNLPEIEFIGGNAAKARRRPDGDAA